MKRVIQKKRRTRKKRKHTGRRKQRRGTGWRRFNDDDGIGIVESTPPLLFLCCIVRFVQCLLLLVRVPWLGVHEPNAKLKVLLREFQTLVSFNRIVGAYFRREKCAEIALALYQFLTQNDRFFVGANNGST